MSKKEFFRGINDIYTDIEKAEARKAKLNVIISWVIVIFFGLSLTLNYQLIRIKQDNQNDIQFYERQLSNRDSIIKYQHNFVMKNGMDKRR